MLTTAKWSIDEYHRMIEAGLLDERRVELLGGDIVEMAPEGEPHAYSSDEAGEYLMRLLGNRAKVRQAKPITLLQDNSEPEPDIAVVERLGREYLFHHPYPQNIYWLIEYADSSLKKDLEDKNRVYAAADVPEYWVIDLKKRELIVFKSPTPNGYQSQVFLKEGSIYPQAFPELEIEVAKLIYS